MKICIGLMFITVIVTAIILMKKWAQFFYDCRVYPAIHMLTAAFHLDEPGPA